MPFNNMTVPALMTSIQPGNFGQLESRTSNYGAVNTFYRNAKALFGEALIAQIRVQPWTREIKIPIFTNYDHTILTVRSCNISCSDNGVTLKSLTRTHLAIDICINPSEFEDKEVLMERALKHRYEQAKKAVYKKLDELSAAFLDLNKDTTMVPDADGAQANPLFKAKAGAYEMDSSLKFYAYLATIMEQQDISGPYLDLTNTVANAEANILRNPGNGNNLATDKLLQGANISEFDFSNRIATGRLLPVHYVAPTGSVGLLNMIDGVYRNKPVIGSPEDIAQWKAFENMTELKMWGQTPDEIFNDWDWGVLQERVCDAETILHKAKFSADWTWACDFTSKAGESPIKRFDIKAMAA
jgi:hypothetical protein